MIEPTGIDRRQFLKISAGIGAGLVLGVSLSGCEADPKTEMMSEEGADEKFSPGVFLKIAPDDTVTVIVPRMEMGQGVRTAMPMIVAEELDADWSRVQVETAPAGEEYGNQETGGSTSIDSYWLRLRQAGATARAMLITAAAQIWAVEPEDCVTKEGEVLHQESGQRLTYGELAATATQMPVPNIDNLRLKSPEEFKLIGESLKRIDDPQFVDGSAKFGLDTSIPAMDYAAVARCPVFGGKLRSFDASKAKAVEGVKDVVEILNAVAVVANNSWAAIQGRSVLDIDWDTSEYDNLNSESIRQEILAQLPEDVAVGNDDARARNRGKLDVLYEIPNLAHVPMEPMNCVVHFQSNSCEVWAPTQNPQLAQRAVFTSFNQGVLDRIVQPLTGWSQDSIKVNVPLIGGGFGRRLRVDYVVEAGRVSEAIKGPVQVVWTREDDIQHDYFHPLGFLHFSAELDPLAMPERESLEGPDIIPHGSWRAVQNFSRAYAEECFIDELADALGQDPYELRLQRYDDLRLINVLKLAAEKGDWGSPLPEGWGRGIAAYKTWKKTAVAEVVELSVSDEGEIKVHRVVCVVDCGIVVNPDMVEAQMEGGIVFALTAALKSKITIENGRVQQSNFHDYPILRMDEMPKIEVHIVPSGEPPTGVGEMSGPPLTPAVANAVFNATGKRVRHIPIRAEDLL